MRCSRCGREEYPFLYVPTPVSIVSRKARFGQWVCPSCLTDEEAGGPRARLLRLLRMRLSRPQVPDTVLGEEYLHALKAAAFRCPRKRWGENCDGHPCPRRPDDPDADDYYDECLNSLRARAIIEEVKQGRVKLVYGNNSGWEARLP